MNRNNRVKEKRKDINVYFSESELQLIKLLVKRVSLHGKSKPLSQIIRKCVVTVAENPELDLFVFAPKATKQITMDELLIRQKLIEEVERNMKILRDHGIDLSDIDNQAHVGDRDELE